MVIVIATVAQRTCAVTMIHNAKKKQKEKDETGSDNERRYNNLGYAEEQRGPIEIRPGL